MQALLELLPDPAAFNVTDIALDQEPQRLIITLATTYPAPPCPQCGEAAHRVHSRAQRTRADLPWAGVATSLRLHIRRWFCDNAACPRRTFTEPLAQIAAPRSRRTTRLAAAQQHLGLAMGGAPGSRLAAALAMPVGKDVLLALVRRAPTPEPAPAPHIGIDDWATRKAHHDGTIIVNLDTRQPIALLDNRSADQVAAWLAAHPEVTVVSRDRGQVYVDGITRGAPTATQVADRWHLLKNLGEALLAVLHDHHHAVTAAVRPHPDVPAPAPVPPLPAPDAGAHSPATPTVADQRREARYAAIHALHARGWTQRAIANHLDLERKTVRTYLRMGAHVRPRQQSARRSCLDPFKAAIDARWAGGCRNAMQILRELHADGFTGQRSVVRSYLTALRVAQGLPPRSRAAAASTPAPAPSVRTPSLRTLTWLVLMRPTKRTAEDTAHVEQLQQVHADISAAIRLAQQFATFVRERQATQLDVWIAEAVASGVRAIRAFASGLTQDVAAVRAGLALRWSQGPVEGQINRLKLLKRQMYGRAKMDLLQQRLLAG